MEVTPSWHLLREVLKRVPMLLKTAILNILSLSPTGGKQDLRTEIIVSIIRSFITFTASATQIQRRSMKDPGVKGRIWISTVKMPRPPESDALDALIKVIEHHKEGDETYQVPDLSDVEAEWTGYRKGVSKNQPPPPISEHEKYRKMMEEVKEDLTVLYFHGGAYHLMDPCTHREVTKTLARLTGGRCLSVRYRLAPQSPFPAAILDALISYLYLLSPPEGAFHTPVPANKIVFAGDSAGGGLSLALLQTLMTLRKISPGKTIRFHGKDVPIELPAGVATISPWCDVTRSLPSTFENHVYDYLIPPPQQPGELYTPIPFPPDATWPSNPPRVEFYANADTLAHPLVSPVVGSANIWHGAPPMLIIVGQESLEDDSIYLARKVHRAGGTMILERYEGMPHCFGLVVRGTAVSRRCFRTWADFCLDAVYGRVQKTGKAVFVSHSGKHATTKDLDEIGKLSDEEVHIRISEGRDWRVEGEKHLVNQWIKAKERARL
ncbi:hypothetical protein VTO42DRAFT_5314 [Malbranchea cinnamomea]